jgi:hypothetical protein
MLGELCLVPVAVADDDLAGPAFGDARLDRGEDVGNRTRPRQVHTRSAAGVVR